ncbi:hypothetical protein [Pseudoduganella violacea]|uniref:Uncharacterized protein n=1 Tax=Pseudoduganella violacea TaxID=1715466 RepID=A0A7W5FW79_9BURK|nr:hypothetical protein [Pseudoduganella violacea]MBB3121549.1 hypothetical protein [Pseudoduganella violacea]
MAMHDYSNQRRDVHTAASIDHGLAVQAIAGPAAALLYLQQQRVPSAIIKRVLASPNGRRQLGAINSGPFPPLF